MDCYDFLMSKPQVLKRFNSHVIAKDSLQVDLSPKSDRKPAGCDNDGSDEFLD